MDNPKQEKQVTYPLTIPPGIQRWIEDWSDRLYLFGSKEAARINLSTFARTCLALSLPPERPQEPEVTFSDKRCSLCGAKRLTSGVCSLIPNKDGAGGCPDPLHDYRAEKAPPSPHGSPAQADVSEKLDAKFVGEIRKVKDGSIVPSDEWIIFLAKDNAFAATLPIYRQKCVALGCDSEQVAAVDRMLERLDAWRAAHSERLKNPDAKGEKLLDCAAPAPLPEPAPTDSTNPIYLELRQIYCCKGAEFCRPTLEKAWKEIARLEAGPAEPAKQERPQVGYLKHGETFISLSPELKAASVFYEEHEEFWVIPFNDKDTDSMLRRIHEYAASFADSQLAAAQKNWQHWQTKCEKTEGELIALQAGARTGMLKWMITGDVGQFRDAMNQCLQALQGIEDKKTLNRMENLVRDMFHNAEDRTRNHQAEYEKTMADLAAANERICAQAEDIQNLSTQLSGLTAELDKAQMERDAALECCKHNKFKEGQ